MIFFFAHQIISIARHLRKIAKDVENKRVIFIKSWCIWGHLHGENDWFNLFSLHASTLMNCKGVPDTCMEGKGTFLCPVARTRLEVSTSFSLIFSFSSFSFSSHGALGGRQKWSVASGRFQPVYCWLRVLTHCSTGIGTAQSMIRSIYHQDNSPHPGVVGGFSFWQPTKWVSWAWKPDSGT